MATSQLTLCGSLASTKVTRKSYTREFKLAVVKEYKQSGKLCQTCTKHGLNTKTLQRWISTYEVISKSSKGSKRKEYQRTGAHPEMEKALFEEFLELRRKGLKVKGYWFKIRAKQILSEQNPSATFCFSAGWFDGFKRRFKLSLRRATNTAQRPASDKLTLIRTFHKTIRRVAAQKEGETSSDVGKFKLSQIANMDQTPLPFSFADGETYDQTGTKTVWVRGSASGMEKRQCTAQLTIFADGVTRVKPLLIFKGTGARITLKEKVSYDPRVRVVFQPSAWCDEPVMLEWQRQQWGKACEGLGETLLVLDVHRAQETDAVKELFKAHNTTPVYVPPGCTSVVQPLDVSLNAPFKAIVSRLANEHCANNLSDYVQGTIPARERRVLFTQWVGQAWEELSSKTEMIKRSFRKCGITVPIDGSADGDIHLEGLSEYTVASPENESVDDEQDDLDADVDLDPFADL